MATVCSVSVSVASRTASSAVVTADFDCTYDSLNESLSPCTLVLAYIDSLIRLVLSIDSLYDVGGACGL